MQRDDLRHYLTSCWRPAPGLLPKRTARKWIGQVIRLVCGATASQSLIEQAVATQAGRRDVHHGYFWKGAGPITGNSGARLKTLLADINLFAFHLPLDLHPEFRQ